jgi:hypothetical protein
MGLSINIVALAVLLLPVRIDAVNMQLVSTTVSGLLDRTGAPIAGAVVTLVADDGMELFSTVSDQAPARTPFRARLPRT